MKRGTIVTLKSRNSAVSKSYQLRKQVKSSRFDLLNRSEWELLDILREAREIYRNRIKRLHPDMPGGSHGKASALNIAWRKVVKMFGKRGVTL